MRERECVREREENRKSEKAGAMSPCYWHRPKAKSPREKPACVYRCRHVNLYVMEFEEGELVGNRVKREDRR